MSDIGPETRAAHHEVLMRLKRAVDAAVQANDHHRASNGSLDRGQYEKSLKNLAIECQDCLDDPSMVDFVPRGSANMSMAPAGESEEQRKAREERRAIRKMT
ncbi:MAG: hypothetical protein ABSB33_05215 [Tepidisphaeraceae bacterium]